MSTHDLSHSSPLKPGDTLGIVGGGQLGRMLAMAAARFSFRTIVLDPDPDCPAAQLCNDIIVAPYDDLAGLSKLAESCDRITYEFENIPVESIQHIEDQCIVFPAPNVLKMSQDRLDEKTLLNTFGIATAQFADIDNIETLKSKYEEFGKQTILKTRRLGYDGKGQYKLVDCSEKDLEATWKEVGDTAVILEKMVPFDCEISVIVARCSKGTIKTFDPAENVHREGILRTSTVPANVSQKIAEKAIEAATTIVNCLAYVGVMGVEFFVCGEEVLVNEIAPRVHNSGHWTEAACTVSQFEQHVRAVCGLPLATTTRHSDCIMENLIGDDIDRVPAILQDDSVYLHLYGKRETRSGRKMGHFTRLS